MKNYEKYKPSGVEWVGVMPEHWEVKRLKFNTSIKARVGWHGLRADEFSLTDGVFCVTGTDLQNGEVSWENCYRVSEERYEEDPYIQLRENDLLITKDGTIGKVAIVKNLNERATLNSGIFVVRPERKEYITSFMYWALQSPVFSEYVNYTSKGSTINHLYQETFFNLPFILPLPEEQTAIASYLDEKTAQVDNLMDNKHKLIELLKEERTAIINQAVTKGINPKTKLKPSGIEWLGDIPEHWEVKKLKYLIKEGRSSIKTGPFGSQIKNSDFVVEGPFKVYNQRNVLDNDFDKGKDFIEENKFDDLKDFEVFERDVLFTTRGTIGKCAIFPSGKQRGVLHPCLIRVQFDDSKVDKEWIRLFVNQSSLFLENVMLLSNSTTIDVIYSYNLKEVYIPLPETIKEQNDILTQIEVETRRLDATISKIEKEIELLQEYRTALISEVVKGKIKVI